MALSRWKDSFSWYDQWRRNFSFYTTENVLPNDNVSMSVGHLDHVLIIYSSMEHVTWKSPGPTCGWVESGCRIGNYCLSLFGYATLGRLEVDSAVVRFEGHGLRLLMLDMAIDKYSEFVKFMLAESVHKGVLDNGNFREFLHGAGGIFDFQNGNSRWPWWSPMLKQEIHKIKCLQRRFTKKTPWFA